MAGILDFLQGKNQSLQNIPRFSPQQMSFQNQALSMAQQNLGTDAIENQARAGFQKNTIPLLSERFANAGGSSGYQNALRNAGSQLELGLAAQKQQNAFNLAGLGLQPQYEQYLQPEQPGGALQGLLSGLGSSLPYLAELGIRGASPYFFGSRGTQPAPSQNQDSNSTLSNVAGAASGIAGAGGLLSGLSGIGSGIGSGLAAAAPFALPLAGGAAVLALPFILSRLLED
jgi:hypothetical protein